MHHDPGQDRWVLGTAGAGAGLWPVSSWSWWDGSPWIQILPSWMLVLPQWADQKTFYCSFVSSQLALIEGVCLLLQIFPDSQMPPRTPRRSQNAGSTGTVADPGCRWVQSHQQKNLSTKDRCEFLAWLNFPLRAQHFGINGEQFRLTVLHPIVPYLLTKWGWQW